MGSADGGVLGRQPALYRDDIRGESTRTGPHLVSFRDWLVEQVNAASSGRFVNATGAGILHGRRLQQASLHDALGDAPPIGDLVPGIRARHAAFLGSSDEAREIAALLERAKSAGAMPVDRWIKFAAETVTADQIRTTLYAA